MLDVTNPATGGGGMVVWSGDASGGVEYSPGNGSIDFELVSGQITLYYNDWYAGDNDEGATTTAIVYRIQP
ncbi:MAG TPA: hypothetical protein VMI54_20820 [Polyangiaceae bacterium]|nr:hypothetical protein [Polyangiaceae bacterium]